MEEKKIIEKTKLIYDDEKRCGVMLYCDYLKENEPFSKVFYWEKNKLFRNITLDFHSEVYGRDKIENYWKEILELDKNKKLTIDSLCDAIDNILFKDMN